MRETSLRCGCVAILIVAFTSLTIWAQTYTTLYTFTGGVDGGQPQNGRLVADSAGNIYGTTAYGGDLACALPYPSGTGCGVVFKVDTSNNETVIYTFTGADGSQPWGGLTLDHAGNLYGTTAFGGAFDAGVLYKLDSSGHQTVLHSFSTSDGAIPTGNLCRTAQVFCTARPSSAAI
jgi:uncharacterized repeat protein (TIGR03803 family)